MRYLVVIILPGSKSCEVLTTNVEAPSAQRAASIAVADVEYISVAVIDTRGRVLFAKSDGRRA